MRPQSEWLAGDRPKRKQRKQKKRQRAVEETGTEEEPDYGSACSPPSCTTEPAVVSSRLLFCCPRQHLSF